MKSHVQVAVIGGGVVGCSVLYHLTKKGWTDVVLLERDELTSGSTWHAAGGMHTFNSDPNVARLQDYTIKLYREIEAVSGQSCGIHMTGGILLAGTPERLDFLKMACAKDRSLGFEPEMLSPEEAGRMHPLIDPRHFLGALWDPNKGHIDPSGVTQAYAKAARVNGAEVYRFTPVTALEPKADGGWRVITDKGVIEAEHVVNAGGLWAREVGRMVGLELPVLAMEHHYLITEDIQEILDHEGELPSALDFEGEIYSRQEGAGGFLIGTYERDCRPWAERETPADFSHELLPPDLDRIAPSLEIAFEHFPALQTAGIKKAINGPFTFAPDGNPLVGPVRGLSNYWVACGVMAGFSQGGGVGLALADWMVEGDPGVDIFAMDVSRYGRHATPAYTNAKVRENYSRRWQIAYPNEELPAARPLRTTPIYSSLKARGAVFGAAFGLEHALWFAPEGTEPREQPTFRRSNAFGPVGAECRAVRAGVGLIETSSYSKYAVTGSGAEIWLARLLAGRIPAVGRMALTPMLNPAGRLIGDFTLAKLGPERFMIFGSGIAEEQHMRWFESRLPKDGSVRVESLASRIAGLSIAGPKARELLSRLTPRDVSNEAFSFLSFREMTLGLAPAMIGRISFTGELGYEIWVTPDYQLTLYQAILEAGQDLDLTHFGSRALGSLRLEKSFGSWRREYTADYTPLEAGLGRFIDWRRNDFVGRDAVIAENEAGAKRRLVTLKVDTADGSEGADAIGNEPVYREGRLAGWVTSGGYGHCAGTSIAMAYLDSGFVNGEAGGFEVALLGEPRPAAIAPAPLVDPEGTRMRG
jgi:dimethylglycine dehydrogenase